MKKLLLTTALVALASPALAGEKGPTVTLGGSLDTQFGYVQQKSDFRNDSNKATGTTGSGKGNQLSKSGIANDTKLHVKVDGQAHGFKYGGMLAINADTSPNKYQTVKGTNNASNNIGYQTMVYGESKFMRLEAGSYTGAADALSVNAGNIARATGGINGDSKYWINQNVGAMKLNGASYYTAGDYNRDVFNLTPSLVSNMDTGNTANASKVTVYSPKFYSVKLGVSYIPDTEQTGTIANLNGLKKKLGNGLNTFAFRDVFSGGLMVDHKMNDVHFKASLLGETGKPKDWNVTDLVRQIAGNNHSYSAKRHDLRAWELGASVAFKGFTVAGSYGDLGKSGAVKSYTDTTANVTTATLGKKSSKYWTAGAAYAWHHFGASVTYMESKKGGAILNADGKTFGSATQYKNLSFGVDYKVAPGFMPYAEVSSFSLNNKAPKSQKNTGNVFLAGAKLQF